MQTETQDGHPAIAPIRALIDRVVLTPTANGPLHIRVEGKLNSLIGGGQYPAMSLGGLVVAEGALPAIPPPLTCRMPLSLGPSAGRGPKVLCHAHTFWTSHLHHAGPRVFV